MISLRIMQAVVLFGATQITPDHVSIAAPARLMAKPDQVSTAAPNMSIAVPDQVSTAVPDQVSTAGTGICPTFQLPVECPKDIVHFCTDDSHCLAGLKCCNVGCENYCVVLDPVYTGVPDQLSTAGTGVCATFQLPVECPEETEHFCTDDSDCPEGWKCCNVGCENDCVARVNPAPNMSIAGTGVCPTFQTPAECPEERDNFCTDDSDCLQGLKCCNIGCENDCVVPDQVSIAAPD